MSDNVCKECFCRIHNITKSEDGKYEIYKCDCGHIYKKKIK